MTDVQVLHGDALDVLAGMDAASVDAIVTDPPYGLEFMGREWDRFSGDVTDRNFKGFVLSQQRTRNVKCPECGKWAYDHPDRLCECGGVRRAQGSAYQQWCERWAAECLRLLKPGGHLLAFGGTRTWHRLVCAIEDAGFEIRDTISWLYASGFPKSLDVSKAIDRAAGAEREVVGNKLDRPGYHLHAHDSATGAFGHGLSSTTRESRLAAAQITAPAIEDARRWQGWGTALKPGWEPIVVARKPLAGTVVSNVLRHGTGALNIDGCRTAGKQQQQGAYNPGTGSTPIISGDNRDKTYDIDIGRWPANVTADESCGQEIDRQARNRDGDIGRFYYMAKASPDERPRVDGVAHPTVKPLELIRWLVRLVTPPGGLVLDPFAGSGTTGEACLIEGFRCVLVEREDAYLPLIHARLDKPIQPVLGEVNA